MTRKTRVIGLVVLLVALVASIGWCHRGAQSAQVAKLETTYAHDTTVYALDTTATDSTMARDSAKPTTVVAVHKERASAKKALTTSRKQVKVLEALNRPARLKLFAEGDYEIPNRVPLTQGTLSAKLGLMLHLRGGTNAQGFISQPIAGTGERTYNVGIRQEFRIY